MILSFSLFEAKIASGAKRQTIRADRADGFECPVGEVLHLWWKSRTPERYKFGIATCCEAFPIWLYADEEAWECRLDGRRILWSQFEELALLDGFDDAGHMIRTFAEMHGYPFTGRVIRWRPLIPAERRR